MHYWEFYKYVETLTIASEKPSTSSHARQRDPSLHPSKVHYSAAGARGVQLPRDRPTSDALRYTLGTSSHSRGDLRSFILTARIFPETESI